MKPVEKHVKLPDTSSTHEVISQPIRLAALGYISGTLKQWPALNRELKKHGIYLPDSTHSSQCRKVCLRIMDNYS